MNLDEALAVYLYLQNSERAAWQQKALEEACGVIYTEAEKTLERRVKEIAAASTMAPPPS